ncbi:MAG: phthiocerol/phthiodiolone dimycocerosyl transferase family protein [Raoultibacter sp.]
MARDTWYRLDNIGKFYSSQAGSSAQTVFRFSATLVDEVDPIILQNALEKTVKVFPGFNVCLRSGMFWHYLEQAAEIPQVSLENLPICFGLHVDSKSILSRVSYYRNRINVEVSHIVSDGRGSVSFFKAILSAYLRERYNIEGIEISHEGSDNQKAENSFDKYYERDKAAPTYAPKVYRLTGWRDVADPTYMEYHLPAKQVVDLARSYGVSLTALIIAAVTYSIRLEMPKRERNRAIRFDIPVDLRGKFESSTTKNFFGLAFVSYVPHEDESVEKIAKQIHKQLKVGTEAESLKPRMNRMISLEKSIGLRFAPLFIKDFGMEIGDRIARRAVTTTVSNLGMIELDNRLAPFVENLNILTSSKGLNFTLCSFGDDLSIGIATVFANHDVIKNLCRYFSEHTINGYLNISKTSEEVAVDQLEAKLEASVKRLSGQAPNHDEEHETDTSSQRREDTQ